MFTTCCNVKNSVFRPHILFIIIITMNNEFFPKQHYPFDLDNLCFFLCEIGTEFVNNI